MQAGLAAYLEQPTALVELEKDPLAPTAAKMGQTAVVPMFGEMGKHLSLLETLWGGQDVDDVADALDDAVTDEGVENVILYISSPGGTVTGTPELARKVAAANEQKPVIAYTDAQAASAAYWVGSQAGRFYASSSATVGSVGVYLALIDETERLAAEGVKVNAIHAGKWKLSGASFKPLTDEEREQFQTEVDTIHEEFKAAVTDKRPGIQASHLEGQEFDGATAAGLGLTDGVVDSLSDLLALTGAH